VIEVKEEPLEELRIGKVILRDLIRRHSVIYYRDKKKRGRWQNERGRRWDDRLSENKPLFNLVCIANELHKAHFLARDFDKTVLQDFIIEFLDGCSHKTARQYATALNMLHQ